MLKPSSGTLRVLAPLGSVSRSDCGLDSSDRPRWPLAVRRMHCSRCFSQRPTWSRLSLGSQAPPYPVCACDSA